ncbi:MAG: hypothetical protein AAGD38_20700 [Acidobacteriota bacterium]
MADREPIARRIDLITAVVCTAVWVVALLANVSILPLADRLGLSLYHYYSIAAVLGWIVGNVFVLRMKLRTNGRWIWLIYLFGPPGWLFVLWAMAPRTLQEAAPMVALYAFVVYLIFFLVPVTLKSSVPRR